MIFFQQLKFISELQKWDDDTPEYGLDTLEVPFYFNKLDEKWKSEKCAALGFTYKEPNKKQKITRNVVPVDILNDRLSMYKTLADFLCGDRKISFKMQKNILEVRKLITGGGRK